MKDPEENPNFLNSFLQYALTYQRKSPASVFKIYEISFSFNRWKWV